MADYKQIDTHIWKFSRAKFGYFTSHTSSTCLKCPFKTTPHHLSLVGVYIHYIIMFMETPFAGVGVGVQVTTLDLKMEFPELVVADILFIHVLFETIILNTEPITWVWRS